MAYVYRHIRNDLNIPFYIGIGSDDNYKRANETSNRNKHWKNIVSKHGYRIHIMIDGISFDLAKEKEIEFIKLYGRSDKNSGPLCNKTNGGDGCFGLIHTDESKLKMSLPNRGKVITEEHRARISEFHKGKVVSDETKRKMSESIKKVFQSRPKRILSDSHKERISFHSIGEKNKASVLKGDDIIEIRKMSANGLSSIKISKVYNVSKTTILNIVNNKTWKHIQ
jgi:hypothetical protein